MPEERDRLMEEWLFVSTQRDALQQERENATVMRSPAEHAQLVAQIKAAGDRCWEITLALRKLREAAGESDLV